MLQFRGIHIRFDHPEWGLAAMLFLLGIILIGCLLERGWKRQSLKLPKLLLSVIPQLLCLGLLCLALVSPHWVTSRTEGKGVLLVDISESMHGGSAERLFSRLAQVIPENLEISVLPFAQSTGTAGIPIRNIGSYSQLRDSWEKLNIGETNLTHALESASQGSHAADPSFNATTVLLLSDGQETEGDAIRYVKEKRTSSRVFPFIPEESERAATEQFQISNLYAPLVVAAQKSAEIRVTVANKTEVSQSGVLQVKDQDKVVYEEQITVEPQSEKLVIAKSDSSKEGLRRVSAELVPNLESFPKSLATAFLSGEKREKLLLLSGSAEDARFLNPVFTEQAFQVREEVAQPRLADLPALEEFSVVALNNIALTQLPGGSAQELKRFVQQGGGLVMIGGNKSFGLGGYIGSAVEEVLPVILRPPEAEQKRLNLGVMLVIDKSRSMAQEQRLEFSKEAAREVVRNLKDDDYLGIIAFDLNPFEVLRMGQLAQIRSHATERIGRIYPGESTHLFPAMEAARRRLEGVPASRKHMIILTDGQLKDAGPRYLESISQMRLLGITVSTVLLGTESDFGFMRTMADRGGGTFHRTTNPGNLARIFLEDIKVRTGERTMKERQEFLVRQGDGKIQSTSLSAFPPLLGFVETRQRPKAQSELVVVDNDGNKPLLSSWEYGQGKVSAFTSDANGRWSQYWADWRGFRTFWSEIIESLRGERWKDKKSIKFDLRYFVTRKELTLDLALFTNERTDIDAIIKTPQGREEKLVFSEGAPGRFVGVLPQAKAGTYEVQLRAQREGTTHLLTPVAFSLSGDLFGERKGEGFNTSLLSDLAATTGGKTNPSKEELEALLIRQEDVRPLRSYLLLIAAFLFCLGVIVRQRSIRV